MISMIHAVLVLLVRVLYVPSRANQVSQLLVSSKPQAKPHTTIHCGAVRELHSDASAGGLDSAILTAVPGNRAASLRIGTSVLHWEVVWNDDNDNSSTTYHRTAIGLHMSRLGQALLRLLRLSMQIKTNAISINCG